MEQRYQRLWNQYIMDNYIWFLFRQTNPKCYNRQRRSQIMHFSIFYSVNCNTFVGMPKCGVVAKGHKTMQLVIKSITSFVVGFVA